MAQRIAQLQEALLHCGKFQDALEPLLSWLADTEDLISNQKPPSAEYKVVKAQIQEQKVSKTDMASSIEDLGARDLEARCTVGAQSGARDRTHPEITGIHCR